MAITSSTVLQTSGLATTLNYAVKPGVQSGGNVVNLVGGGNKAVSKSAGASLGSDSDGNYVDVTTSTDWCDIAYGRAADGNGFSVVMVVKLDQYPASNAFATLSTLKVDSTHSPFSFENYDDGGSFPNSLQMDVNQFATGQWLSERDAILPTTTGTLVTIVITWDGVSTGAKIFTTGTTVHSMNNGDLTLGGQDTSTAPTLTLSSDVSHAVGWPAKHYFWAWSDTTWTDTQAQNVADDVFGQLLSNGGSTYNVGVTEAASASDSVAGSVVAGGGGTSYDVSVNEAGSANATSVATLIPAGATTVFNGSTALSSTSLATSLKRAYLLGVPGVGANTVKELVQAADRNVVFHGAAALAGPDTEGDYLNVPAGATDWAEVDWTLDPAGGGYSVVMCVRPSDLNPASFADFFSIPTGTAGWHVFQFGRNGTTNDLWEGHNKFENWFFPNGIDFLTADGFVTLVVTWNGVDQPKLFATGKGTPKLMDDTTGHHLGAQDGGVPTTLRVANSPTNNTGWSGKYYFFAYSDTTWADADAQAVADDVAAELFVAGGGGGGGPSMTTTTTLDRLSVMPTNLEIEARSVTVTKLNGIETARRYSRITFPKGSNVVGQPDVVQNVALAAWGAPITPPPGGGTGTGNGVAPAVTDVQNSGYVITHDFTFGTVAGTIRDYTTLWQWFDALQIDGNGNSTIRAQNDEWQQYTNPADVGESSYNGVTHILDTDHLKLRVVQQDSGLFTTAVNRAQTDPSFARTVDGAHPDGRYWGNAPQIDTGIRSANISAKPTQLGGYFEICCQLPSVNGTWPGWWMIAKGGEWPPEIDMQEIPLNGYDLLLTHNGLAHLHTSKTVCGASPFDNSVPNRPVATNSDAENGTGFYSNGTNWRLDYHIVGFEWLREGDSRGDHVKFWLDQTLIFDGYFPWMDSCANVSPPAVFQLQHAYGGDWPGRGGGIASATFPADYNIKYFRMFAK